MNGWWLKRWTIQQGSKMKQNLIPQTETEKIQVLSSLGRWERECIQYTTNENDNIYKLRLKRVNQWINIPSINTQKTSLANEMITLLLYSKHGTAHLSSSRAAETFFIYLVIPAVTPESHSV